MGLVYVWGMVDNILNIFGFVASELELLKNDKILYF